MAEISAELSQKLSDAVEKMPPFPKSAQRILELSRDSYSDHSVEPPPAVVERFGANLDEIIVKLGDLSNVIAEAQTFAQTSKEIQT